MPQEIHKRNIELLSRICPQIIPKLKDDKNISILTAKNGEFTAQIIKDNKKLLLHSIYNPSKEAENFVSSILKDKYDYIFIGGFGLGYVPETVLRLTDDNTNILIFEENLSIFNLACRYRDFTALFSNNRVGLIISKDIGDIMDYFWGKSTKKILILIPRISYQLNFEYYTNVKNLINSFVHRKNINIATISRFQKLWLNNIFRNIKFIIELYGINNLLGQFKNIPAIVVGAGPSLNKNIHILKTLQRKAIIISVDTALKILLKYNIIPDFVFAVDPQIANYKYFEYLQNFDALLIAEPSVYPKILRDYKGIKLLISSVFPAVKWLEEFTGTKVELDMGGSVSTTAFDFAYKIGCNPVILVGQDLAFTDGMSHCKGAYAEKYFLLRLNKFLTIETMLRNYTKSNLSIKVKDKSGGEVETDRRLLLFLWWFENKIKNIKINVIDATEGGAKISGTTVLSLKETVKKYCTKEIIDIKSRTEKYIFNKLSQDISELKPKIITGMDRIIQELNLIKNYAEQALKISKNLYNDLKKRRPVQNYLNKLDELDAKITKNQSMNKFISLSIQNVIHTILEGYEDGLTEEEKKNEELKVARKSILIYEAVLQSSEFNLQLFKQGKNIISNDKN